jgi:hypothetical protein
MYSIAFLQGLPEVIDRLLVVLQVAVPEPAVGVHHHLLRLILGLFGFFQHGSLHNNTKNNIIFLTLSVSLSVILCGTLFFIYFISYNFEFRRMEGSHSIPIGGGGGGGGQCNLILFIF